MSTFRSLTALYLLLFVQQTQAETIRVPLQVDFPLLRQLLVSQIFQGESTSTEMLKDPSDCSKITLYDPRLSEAGGNVQIDTRLRARLAMKMLDKCVPLLNWDGYAKVVSKAVIKADNPRLVYIQVIDSQLISLDHKPLTSGALWDQARKHIHPLFERFQVDLRPSINELTTFLPLFLPRHSQAQLNNMLATLQLANLQVAPEGIHSELVFDVDTIILPEQTELALNEQEQLQWQQKWQSMDALLTHAIKKFAAATELKELRLALFDILLEARYQLVTALHQDHAKDPVRHWFISSWVKLIPLIRKISAENPQHATLTLVTLITASDALQTLDKLGPTFGLDISIDGLRRLARLLNESKDADPLRYDDALDPELLRLFQLTPPADHNSRFEFNFWPISNAEAATERSLDNWVPKIEELDAYLLQIRTLLLNSAQQTLSKSTLSGTQQDIFRKILLATAWQESCWRQYIVKGNKIVPLSSSTGDTGIMQINEKVWRGFVDIHKLRWNIAYNVESGSQILFDYMTRYAIKKSEHKLHGGLDNLARATYSAYNGGPGQIARYRNHKAARQHKKIDNAFHDKYLTVKQGNELAVGQCLGQNKLNTAVVEAPKKRITPVKQQQEPGTKKQKLIHNETWIKQQSKKHFTLQLGVFSSRHAAINFIRQQRLNGNYAIYQKRNKGASNFAVIYGYYSSRQGAEMESSRFKPIKPWIRPFTDIRVLILS